MEQEKKLHDLKPGDLVFWSGNRLINQVAIFKIERTTKTQIILTNGSKYNNKSGRLANCDKWSVDRIGILIEERIGSVTFVRLKTKAANMIKKISIPDKKEDIEKLIISIEPFLKSGD